METSYKSATNTKTRVKKPPKYKVIIYNDDYTTMEFVVDILITIFNKTIEEANNLMLDVHVKGQGIAGIYVHNIAVTKANETIRRARSEGFPLKVGVESE